MAEETIVIDLDNLLDVSGTRCAAQQPQAKNQSQFESTQHRQSDSAQHEPSHTENQPEQQTKNQTNTNDFYFSNLLTEAANAANANENTDYFKNKYREYVVTAETQFMRQCSQFLKNKRHWEEIANMDIEVKRRKTELDNVMTIMAELNDELAIKQLRYERAVKRVSTQVDTMMESIHAEKEGGILAFAHSTRECVICRDTKRETTFVWNVVCSHSICFVCLKRSRDSGVRTCMVCRAKQPSSSFLVLSEAQGCRFIATPM